MEKLPFGAVASIKDSRTVNHEDMKTMATLPLLQGGYDYIPSDIEHQHFVGICTAISLVQNAEKTLGKKFSPDFHWLLQKKYFDLNWYEGSSILNSLKTGKNYGFLPTELFVDKNGVPYVTEADRSIASPGQTIYETYIAKLQAIPDAEIERLIALCTDKLTGYASVDVSEPQNIAKAITDSQAGILCMYSVGDEWYTAMNGTISWATADIDPIRPPNPITSGHAITYSKFDYTTKYDGIHANTWGITWDMQGLCNIVYGNYQPVEGWIPYYSLTPQQTQELQQKLIQTQTTLIGVLQQFVTYLKSKILASS